VKDLQKTRVISTCFQTVLLRNDPSPYVPDLVMYFITIQRKISRGLTIRSCYNFRHIDLLSIVFDIFFEVETAHQDAHSTTQD
jgi:hypothetical protein